ncbi:hypothetical protein ADK41_27445 [Streptomyces caelestis]|uniref:Uncharacterized protein n=1 Tax=Streptomyces caelestis TaxID=36816 RepID=A0A0M9X6S8_9ACTN|nr:MULTISPECIES: hypothetical protein [Streptomyces]KOT33863.1 hypothetical protein ADK41_27445 [Streptomyces caelestis]
MSRSIGAHTADPCPKCRVEEVRIGTPSSSRGRDVVDYRCDRCGRTWFRPVEDDLDVYDTVRVDLPDVTLYGTVRQVEDDRVQVRDTDSGRMLWVDLWRVILY